MIQNPADLAGVRVDSAPGHNFPEDELPFPASVAGVDDLVGLSGRVRRSGGAMAFSFDAGSAELAAGRFEREVVPMELRQARFWASGGQIRRRWPQAQVQARRESSGVQPVTASLPRGGSPVGARRQPGRGLGPVFQRGVSAEGVRIFGLSFPAHAQSLYGGWPASILRR